MTPLILLCVAVLLVTPLLVAVCRALLLRAAPPRSTAPAVDEAAAQQYARHLSRMVACPTLSGGAGAPDAFTAFRKVLQGCYPRTFSSLRGIPLPDATLLHWAGEDAARDAVLLMAHSDVVAADGEWPHPPFGGDISDGAVWGRGAMDTKSTLCAMLEAVEALLSEGFIPPCDVYIASSHNEEIMGPGAQQVRAWFEAQGIPLALVHDEGGAVLNAPLPGLCGTFALVGIIEKGYANVRFTATSPGGHASTPPKNSPIARLAAFVNGMEKRPPFKKRITGPARQMLATLAPRMGFGGRLVFGNLWLFAPLACRLLARGGPQGAAMLQTTCAFTMAEGSGAPNVLPQSAGVTANLRFIMHQPMDPSLEALQQRAKRHGLAMEVLYANDLYPAADTTGAAWRYFTRCTEAAFPEATVSPYIMLAGTDARHFAAYCPCTLRFSPLLLTARQLAAMHGIGENIGVDALYRAVGFYRLLLSGLGALSEPV